MLEVINKIREYFSRKFVLAGASLGFGYHLVLIGKDIEGWAILVGVVLAFYNGSNVAEKFTTLKGGKVTLSKGSTGDDNG